MGADGDQSDCENEQKCYASKEKYWSNACALLQCWWAHLRSFLGWLHSAFSKPDNLPGHLTWFFTFLLVVFAYYAWTEATRGTRAIEGQLSAMLTDQRPWIKLRVEPKADLKFVSDGTVMLPLKITLENIGKAPALNIRFGLWSYIQQKGRPEMTAEWHERCERLKNEPLANAARGHVLFPGDKPTLDEIGLAPLSALGILGNEVQAGVIEQNEKKYVPVWFYGCIDYGLNAGNRRGQSGFSFQIQKIQPPTSKRPVPA